LTGLTLFSPHYKIITYRKKTENSCQLWKTFDDYKIIKIRTNKTRDMIVPQNLLTKTKNGRFQGRISRILEEGWTYLRSYFKNKDDYFDFLRNLSEERYENFLYTIFFYWAHDLYRIIKKDIKDPNIIGFMYQITLSIIEYLNKNVSNKSKERIKDFFTKYFSNSSKVNLKSKIIARSLNSISLPEIEPWEILYDKRNEFIHKAKWFVMKFEDSFASLGKVKRKNGNEYLADIRLQFPEYLELFWEAYLKYFGKR